MYNVVCGIGKSGGESILLAFLDVCINVVCTMDLSLIYVRSFHALSYAYAIRLYQGHACVQ